MTHEQLRKEIVALERRIGEYDRGLASVQVQLAKANSDCASGKKALEKSRKLVASLKDQLRTETAGWKLEKQAVERSRARARSLDEIVERRNTELEKDRAQLATAEHKILEATDLGALERVRRWEAEERLAAAMVSISNDAFTESRDKLKRHEEWKT